MSNQAVNVLSTYDASASNKEVIHDVIMMTERKKTPLLSMLDKNPWTKKAKEVIWLKDGLGDPDLDNAEVEGFEYNFDASDSPDRVKNHHTIFSKSFRVSNSQDEVDKIGRSKDSKRMMVKRGIELRIDIEAALLKNQPSVAGSNSVKSRMAGLPAWLETNRSMGTGGSAGGYNTATGIVDAAVNGTQRPFSETLLKDVIQSTYTESNSEPNVVMMAPHVKQTFSEAVIGSNKVVPLQTVTDGKAGTTAIGAVDFFVSDFGLLATVVNPKMPKYGADIARNVFLLDDSKARMNWLRPIHKEKNLAKTGDYIPGLLVAEASLVVDDEKCHGMVADIFGVNSTT